MNYQRLYEYRFDGIDQAARESVWVEIASYIHEITGSPQRVLDPAAGRGEFINNVSASERWAVDLVAYEEGTYRDGVKSVVSDIFDADLPTEHFDLVWVSNFTEHLLSQEQCAEFLEKMHSVLRPGGRLAVMGPNYKYCADEYFDCADHTLVFSHLAMAEHVYAAGFDEMRVTPRFLPYSFRGKLPPSPTLTRRYLRTPALWKLLGKQFLVIGTKS